MLRINLAHHHLILLEKLAKLIEDALSSLRDDYPYNTPRILMMFKHGGTSDSDVMSN